VKQLPLKGRHTNDPKTISSHFRLSDEDVSLLKFCCEKTGLTKTEVIRRGIREVYAKIKK
jgi:hypothetical protein